VATPATPGTPGGWPFEGEVKMVAKKKSGKWMNPHGKTIVKHPGALRRTAKRMGLLKGSENLSASDLATMKRRGGPKTRKRVGLTKTFKNSKKG